ncbi:DUF4315 family protein [Butyrivibrio sp. FC2001]|uniref:DUF4315 family protein n=1 Tax=Butyrivibrio sp. FC2001 TaxID=1280671 RepID=UPI0004083B3B|nr:DUF4315 family protein [Butyrivibrio sp. FC2001]
MDKQIEKINLDIEKEEEKRKILEEKLKASTERLKQLRAKKTEIEDSEMVKGIRDLNISPEELKEILSSIRQKKNAVIKEMDAMEKRTFDKEQEEKAV